jgi:hypothetical protein
MGQTGCPETSVTNYLSALRTLTEVHRPQEVCEFGKNSKTFWGGNAVCLMHMLDAALMI